MKEKQVGPLRADMECRGTRGGGKWLVSRSKQPFFLILPLC